MAIAAAQTASFVLLLYLCEACAFRAKLAIRHFEINFFT